MTNEEIKKLALANGFKLKDQPGGTEDLNPYVYEFARALLVKATQHTLGNVAQLLSYIVDFGPDTDPKVIDSEVYEIRHRMTGKYYDSDQADDFEPVRGSYPIQPVFLDQRGRPRFEENPIVSWLARDVSDLNAIAIWCIENEIDPKYQEQLAQLIGYSIAGYGELSYVSDASYERAAKAAAALSQGDDS